MNIDKKSFCVKLTKHGLTHQENLNDPCKHLILNVEPSKRQTYVSPRITPFLIADVILNQIGSNGDGIAAEAQS